MGKKHFQFGRTRSGISIVTLLACAVFVISPSVVADVYDANDGLGPQGDLILNGTPPTALVINTDDNPSGPTMTGAAVVAGEVDGGVAVFRFNNVAVTGSQTVTVTGSRPLAIVSANDMEWTVFINASNGLLGGGLGGAGGPGGTTGGTGGAGGTSGGGAGGRGAAGSAGNGSSGGSGGNGGTNNGGNGGGGGNGAAGGSGSAGGPGTNGFGNEGNGGLAGTSGNGGTQSNTQGGGGSGGSGATPGNGSAGATNASVGSQGGIAQFNSTTGTNGTNGENGGSGTDGGDGGNGNFTVDPNTLTIAAGHGGAGGGGGGRGAGGQGGGKGGGGGSGGGGGGGGGANATGDGDCGPGPDANGGAGGQGGAGGAGGNGGSGATSGAAGSGGNGANGGGAVVLAARGLLEFAATIDISPGIRSTGGGGSSSVSGTDPGFNGGSREGAGSYQNPGGGTTVFSCPSSCPFGVDGCSAFEACPSGCGNISSAGGGGGSLGSDGGRGGRGGDAGSSGAGGDGGYGTPGMVKLQGSVVLASTGSILTANTGGSSAANRNGRFTMVTNMSAAQTTAKQPSFSTGFLVSGRTDNPSLLEGTTPYDALTDHPVIGELTSGVATHGVMQSSFWNQGVILPLASERLELIRVNASTANNPLEGFDQIFLVNNTPFTDPSATTLEGVFLQVGAGAQVLIDTGGTAGELPDGVIYSTTVAAGQAVNINTPIDITDPLSKFGQPFGLPVDFSVSVLQADGNVTFQWQESSNGVTFFDINDNATFSGTNTDTLTVIANNSTNNKFYRVVAEDNTDMTNSFNAQLGVNLFFEVQPPTITGPNVTGKYYFNEQVVLESQFSGPTDEWLIRWTREDIGFPLTQAVIDTQGPNNENFPTLNIPPTLPATAANEGGYRVIGNEYDGGGVQTGTIIQQPMAGNPAISVEFRAPVNPGTPTGGGTYLDGQSLTAVVSPTGGYLPLTYQWQFSSGGPFINLSDGGVISGTQTDTLMISSLDTLAHTGDYRVVVGDDHLDVNNISGAITVTVTDALAIALRTGTATGIDGLVASSTDLTTVYSDLPVGGGSVQLGMDAFGGIGTYTYEWFKDGIGPIDGTEFLAGASYSGFATDTLTIDPMNSGNLTAGVYTCRVYDPAGPAGGVLSPGITVTVAAPFFFSQQPANDTVNVTESTSFSVTAQGGIAPRNFQWEFFSGSWTPLSDGGSISGATTDSLSIDPVGLADAGDYRCVVDDNGAGATGPRQIISNTATLTVTNNLDISVPDLSVYDGDDPVVITTAAGGGNPGSYAYAWERDTGSGFAPVVNGGNISGAGTAALTISPVSNADAGTYRVTLTDGVETPAVDTGVLGVFQVPTVTVQPQDFNTYDGFPASFSVTVTGGIGPLVYDWRLNSSTLGLPSAAGAVFTVILANDGSFVDVFIQDSVASDATAVMASTTSSAAQLGVGPLLTVSQPTPTPVQRYTDGANITLSSTVAGGLGTLNYAWTLTDGATVVPLGPGDGAGNITIDPSSVPQGDFDAVLTITDDVGPTASLPASVEIKNHLTIVPPGIVDSEAIVDDDFTFTITIDGGLSPITYEWSFDDGSKAFVPIAGATGPSLTLSPVVAGDEGTYQVVVTDTNSEQATDSAFLTVSSALPATGALGLALLAAVSALGGAATLRRRKK